MSQGKTHQLRGELIARALAGSWRNPVEPFALSDNELAAITPVVIKAATGALLWRQIRDTSLTQSASGIQLHNLYRLHHLESAVHAHKIKAVLTPLREAAIDCVLIKGWNTARFYPEPGLRHYGDLDLSVAPDQYRRASQVIDGLGPLASYVDLHRGLGRHERLSWTEILANSEVIDLEGVPVRVLGTEDHLRLLCLHWLRHGAWSPLGLCDIAVALETRRSGFDWDKSLRRDKKHAEWMVCALGLAHQLVGARINDTPIADRAQNLPRWLVPAVLEQWQTCDNPNYRDMALADALSLLSRPRKLMAELNVRWRHPIRATIEARGGFNNRPRWPYQVAALLLRSHQLPRQIWKMSWRQIRS